MKANEVREKVKEIWKENYDEEVPSIEFRNMKRQAGRASYSDNLLIISKRFLERANREDIIKMLKHEIAHIAVYNITGMSQNHNSMWEREMKKLGVETPKRTHDYQLAEYKYIITCSNDDCDHKFGRYRKSKVVKCPHNYTCPKCGSKLESDGTDISVTENGRFCNYCDKKLEETKKPTAEVA